MAPVPSFKTLYLRPDSDVVKSLVSTSVVGSASSALAEEILIRDPALVTATAAPAVPAVRTKDLRSVDIVIEKAAAEPTSARRTMMRSLVILDRFCFLLISFILLCSIAVMKSM